ncbi:TPA: hypothetical protein MYN63_004457 [Klebsiella variicola subsp. variicola]|uniref:YjeJ family protein n=1 Tax=Klebsiella variicola TaxID=244366 RepID=UPI000E2A5F09|nr:YjeJ family protein [Klebsiella variicola]MCE0159954.1 YjeJ family protein [Klebsiella variicola subsp. variicola]SXE49873.1 Uncharacterised protein [Klebsiella variicola]HCB1195228.1 hypothetical protein [Klebsiella variicola subsp. variicola]HCI6730513.1 hypothetical protein [Klebsiella variicola subsp. variicola]
MNNLIKGINTGTIMHEGHLLAIVLKVRNSDGIDECYTMQHTVIRDFLLITQNRLMAVMERLQKDGEKYKTVLIAESQALISQSPVMQQEDVECPDPAKRIMSIALKKDSETFTIIAALQSEQIVTLRFSNGQAEIILRAMIQALQNSGDKEAILHFSGTLDFIMLYDCELDESATMNYQYYSHDEWRKALFPNHVAILFSYHTEEGEKLLCGCIVKTYLNANDQQIQNVALRIMHLIPKFRGYNDKHQIKRTFMHDLPAEDGQTLSAEQGLKFLKNYYQETKVSLGIK